MRHGAPQTPGRMIGHGDWPATAAGLATCIDRAAGLPVRLVVSSDLQRARHAAERIAQARGLPLRIDARWRELDFGAWDGLTAADIAPAALEAFWNDPDAAPPPGGERWSSLVARVSTAIAALPREPALVVTHGGAMRAALAALCGFGLPQLWAFALPYAALLSLTVRHGPPATAEIMGLQP